MEKKAPISMDELQSVLDTLNGLTLTQLQALKAERVGEQWAGLRYLIDVVIERNEYKK
jgi:hypothetical protein